MARIGSVGVTNAGRARLLVVCRGGLCNRMRTLVSGVAIAEASGRRFEAWWPLTADCEAPFEALFEAPWAITTVSEAAAREAVGGPHSDAPPPDLLRVAVPDVIVEYFGWLDQPERFSHHRALRRRAGELFPQLRPRPTIAARAARLRAERFRGHMLGVHLRRGDYRQHRPEWATNTASALAIADDYLGLHPAAGLYLTSDDGSTFASEGPAEGVAARFAARYGERLVVNTPASLSRGAQGIEDALVDLLLLRATDALIGTAGSSFSELGVFAREVPWVRCEKSLAELARVERWARATGARRVLMAVAARHFGHAVPFAMAWEHFRQGEVARWLLPTARHLMRWRPT